MVDEETFYDSLEEDNVSSERTLISKKLKSRKNRIAKKQAAVDSLEEDNTPAEDTLGSHKKIKSKKRVDETNIKRIFEECPHCKLPLNGNHKERQCAHLSRKNLLKIRTSASKIPKSFFMKDRGDVDLKKPQNPNVRNDITRIIPLYAGDALKIALQHANQEVIIPPVKKDQSTETSKPQKTPLGIKKNDTPLIKAYTNQDFSKVVPLYSGDLPKSKLCVNKNKAEKVKKDIVTEVKPKKSYLTIYYERLNKTKNAFKSALAAGSNTSRAVCDNLSPKRELDLELQTSPALSNDDSENEEFYQKFISTEIKPSSVRAPYATSYPSLLHEDPDNKKPLKSQSTSRIVAQYMPNNIITPRTKTATEKLEQLKKRLNYGTKMSMLNRIKIQEQKVLKDIETKLKKEEKDRKKS